MTATDLKDLYHNAKRALVLRGLFGVALGIFILARPLDSLAAFAIVIALWAIFEGIIGIVYAFDVKPIAPHWWVLLLGGIVSLIFGGAALYYYPGLSLSYAVVLTSLWLGISGIIAVYVAVQERKLSLKWGWTMTFGFVAIAVGILAMAYPNATLTALLAVIAAYGLVGGTALLIGAGRLQGLERQVRDMAPGGPGSPYTAAR